MRMKYFTLARKMPIFLIFQTLRRARGALTRPENHFESNQICFSSRLG